jgi:predicted PurR-regulated permease PerM
MSTGPAVDPSTQPSHTERPPSHAPHAGDAAQPGHLPERSRPAAATSPSPEGLTGPEPVRLIAFEPKALRRTVIGILLIVTLWMTALWVFSAVSRFLFLLLLSWLFAMAMEPAVARLARRGLRRGLATGLVGGSILVVVAVIGGLFGNVFFTQLSDLVKALPGVVTEVISWTNRTFKLQLDANTVATGLQLTPSQVGTMASDLAGGVLGLVSSLLNALLDVFTFIVFAFYLAADGPRVRRTIGSWLSPAHQDVFVTVWDIAVAKTGGYVVSKVELAALSAVFHSAFFNVAGVPYWLPLALLVGLLAQFVPVIGTYIGIVIPVLLVVFTSPLTALWILLFAAVYQQVETYLLTPRISRRTMDVNSGIALAAVFVGSALWGVIGALIGIPLAAAGVALLDTYGHRHELVPALAVEPPPTRQSENVQCETPHQDGAGPNVSRPECTEPDDARLSPDADLLRAGASPADPPEPEPASGTEPGTRFRGRIVNRSASPHPGPDG